MNKQYFIAALAALHFTAFGQSASAPLPAASTASSVDIGAAGQAPASAQVQPKHPTVVSLKRVSQPKAPQAKQASTVVAQKTSGAPSGHLALPLPKVRSQSLPGLGTMPGEASDTRIKSVRVGGDRNEMVYVSLNQLNKFATPFENPQIIDASGAVLKVVGQDLFLKPANDTPFTVYISNGSSGQSTGITLVPRANLPAQTIVLQPDTPRDSRANVSADSDEVAPGDYVSRIKTIVEALSMGKTPVGFTKSRLPSSVVTGKELVIQPQHKYAGATYDLYAYRVRSIAKSPLEMKEDAFYTEAVRAVAFYPSAMLQTGEETMVYIVADRPALESNQ